MLLRLNPETDKARDRMKALGIITDSGANAFFDAGGNMEDMATIAGVLQRALGGLTSQARTEALQDMFGQDAIRAAASLFQAGANGGRDFAASMGTIKAADVAAI